MLATIMEKQRELQNRLGTNFSNLTDEERAAFMRNHRGYLEDELAEALYEMPYYKLWKDYSTMSEGDRLAAWQKVRMELVDSLHFFVNLLLCAGFTAEELYEMYMAKNKENHRRQDDGYTADVSYRDQAVEAVMSGATYKCVVEHSGTREESDDYIAVLCSKDGAHSLWYNTDALSLGIAYKMLLNAFNDELKKCSDEDAKEVISILTGGNLDG